eukprot:scaffold10084_cov64-Phaeocystis_antarctica.AAC.1
MSKAAAQRLRPIRPPARPASARVSSGRASASASLGQPRPASASLGQPRPASASLGQPRPASASWQGIFWLAKLTGLVSLQTGPARRPASAALRLRTHARLQRARQAAWLGVRVRGTG